MEFWEKNGASCALLAIQYYVLSKQSHWPKGRFKIGELRRRCRRRENSILSFLGDCRPGPLLVSGQPCSPGEFGAGSRLAACMPARPRPSGSGRLVCLFVCSFESKHITTPTPTPPTPTTTQLGSGGQKRHESTNAFVARTHANWPRQQVAKIVECVHWIERIGAKLSCLSPGQFVFFAPLILLLYICQPFAQNPAHSLAARKLHDSSMVTFISVALNWGAKWRQANKLRSCN